MKKATETVPDPKAGVTPKRFRLRFPLTSFAPIAVEVREVAPIEVVRRRGRIAIHVAPELADRIRNGDREARLDLLRVLGRKLLFIRPPEKTFGPTPERAAARGVEDVETFAREVLAAAAQGRDRLVKRLAFAVEARAWGAQDLCAFPEGDDNEDIMRDGAALADVVLELLRLGAPDKAA